MRAIWERAPRTPGSSRKPSSLRQSTDGPLVSMQSNMNLFYREEEREMIPLCQDENIASLFMQPSGFRSADSRVGTIPALPVRQGGQRQV